MAFRTETDTLGEVRVPAEAYYGAQTARAMVNFPAGGDRVPLSLIHVLGTIKRCAAETNEQLGTLEPGLARLVSRAAAEVAEGRLDDHFPLTVWQSGSGTQTHMNVNEVIAGRANELAGSPRGGKSPVHPNDHVNLGQSTNDVFPTAMHLAILESLMRESLPALAELRTELAARADSFSDVVKIGRTHLMDAVPLTLGQEFSGYAHQVEAVHGQIEAVLTGLKALTLGGTAVGTGLNAPEGFAERVIARLAKETEWDLRPVGNRFAAQGAHDAVVQASGAVRGAAVTLMKIANDIRLMGSGPRCGLGELRLPADEPGSSIMPGKVNPTQAEALTMICAQIMGLDAAVAVAGASGHLELNAFKPLMVFNLLTMSRLLADGARSFTRRCVAGLEPDGEAIATHVSRSLMLVTALVPRVGYDRAAEAARKAQAEGLTLREAVLTLELLGAEEYDDLIRKAATTGTVPEIPRDAS